MYMCMSAAMHVEEQQLLYFNMTENKTLQSALYMCYAMHAVLILITGSVPYYNGQ